MRGVLDYLEEGYKKCPNKTMLADEERAVTYEQVRTNAINIASFLEKNNQHQKPILVLSDRKSYTVELFWSILYSDNFYVPLNYKTNNPLFCNILNDLKPIFVLMTDENKKAREECQAHNIECYTYKELLLLGDGNLYSHRAIPDCNPAYMVYTSGSTGKPKGVIKTHRSIHSFVDSFCRTFSMNSAVFGNQTEFDYDVAAKDIFISAHVLGTMEIIPKKYFLMPGSLMEYLFERQVSMLIWSVAGIRYIAKSGALKERKNVPAIAYVFFSGEAIDVWDLKQWIAYFPSAKYVNLYAPSEVTGNCLYYEINSAAPLPDKIPLGKPFDNIDVFALTEEGKIMMEGEKGELFVRGDFLSSGYYQEPNLTNDKFKQNPLHNDFIDLVYQTGDLAELINGQLYFTGRTDEQIKFMGHRMELSEIEYAFSKQDLGQCCCCFYSEKNELIAFHNSKHSRKEIMQRLSEILPKYKLSAKYIYVSDFIYNSRGKLDKKNMLLHYKEDL